MEDMLDDIVVTGQEGTLPDEAVVAAAVAPPPAPKPDVPAVAEPEPDDYERERGEEGEPKADPEPSVSDAARELAKGKGSLQKRIDQFKKGEAEAIRREAAEKERADRAEARARELEAKLNAPATEDTPKPAAAASAVPDTDPEPDLAAYDGEDGKTYEKWVADMAKWSARQAIRDNEAQRQTADRERVERETASRTQELAVAAHLDRIEAFKGATPDFDTVLANTEAVTTPLITDFIQRSDAGPAVAYFLAKNPELSQQIAEMTVGNALVALGRIEGQLPAEAASRTGPAPRIPVSSAPPPGRPVGARAAVHVPDDDLDTDDFIERRNQEERQRRGR